MTSSVIGIDTQTNQRVEIPQASRRQGLYIIGAPGMGKTGLIENLIIEDMKQGLGLCLLDPHGDLTQAVLARIPDQREQDVIYLDLLDTAYPFGLNLYQCDDPTDDASLSYARAQVMHIFSKLWGDESGHLGVRVERYLRNSATTLIVNGYTMAELPLLFRNKNARAVLTANLGDQPEAIDFWDEHTSLKPDDQQQRYETNLNRADAFLSERIIYNIVGQQHTTINFRHIMDERKILLVKLDARREEMTNLIGALMIAQFLNAAYSRSDIEIKRRKQFHIYADEFQRFATEDFATLLTEARKFGIAVTIAHQFRNQLDLQNKGATLNVANLVVFRIIRKDADEIAGQFDVTPPPVEPRKLAVPQNVIDQLVSSHTSHPNPEIRELITKVLVSQREKVEEARAAALSYPWKKGAEAAPLARLRFLNRLLRDVLERRLLPTDTDFLSRIGGADPDHPPPPKPPEPPQTPEALLYQTVSAFTSEEEWNNGKQHYQQFWLDMTFQATIDQPSSTGTGMTTRQVSFQPFQTDADLQAATPTQLLALLKFKLLLMRDTSVFPFLKNSLASRLPKAEREQAIRDTFTQLTQETRLYELWDEKLNKERERESLYGTSTFPPVSASFIAGTVESLTILPFAGLTSLSQEYEGCCPVGFSEDILPALLEAIRTYPSRQLQEALDSSHRWYWCWRDYQSESESDDKEYNTERHIPVVKAKARLIDLLNRYGAAVLVAQRIFIDAASRVSYVNTIYANAPEPQISGLKSQIDVLRSINRLALTIARNRASKVDWNEPVNEETMGRRSYKPYKEMKRAIEDELFRRNQLRTLIASEHIELVALLHKELTAADADIHACVQEVLEADPLAAAYLIARAHTLVCSGSRYANQRYPEPHLPGIPTQTVQQTIAKLVNLYDEREGLGSLLHYWTQQARFSVLVVHLPEDSVRLPADLEDLRRLCELLAEDKNREPLLVPAGYDAVLERPLTYAEMADKIANELTNLREFNARVRIATDAGLVEHTIRTLDPKQQPDRPLFGQALKDRIERIKAQNRRPDRTGHSYCRSRQVVEEEIRRRHLALRKPPPEPPAITRQEPV